ncbi:MAG: zinc-ribbon domain-containing protein [Myxococcota bacterium]
MRCPSAGGDNEFARLTWVSVLGEVGMKLVCDQCGTRYSVSDDHVRGKGLKIRCKTCSNIIVVPEPNDSEALGES